jgi:LmbE family N-acetylglucosaminyl deacetylase
MTEPLRLLCVLAHPDDETLGTGPTLAKYADEGIETYLITATRGERGWTGAPQDNPGHEALGKLREGELFSAARLLGLREVRFLDYIDGDLDQADPDEAISKIASHLRQIRPQVVITFAPDGAYGHPDHIAISQFATAAIVRAADANFVDDFAPFSVSKLYFRITTQREAELYLSAFGDIVMPVDDVERRVVVWPDWSVSARLETAKYWDITWQAVSCHRSQLPQYNQLTQLTEDYHRQLWNCETYYRAFSFINNGRTVEDDLFYGLR